MKENPTGKEKFVPDKKSYSANEKVKVICHEGYGLLGEYNSIECVSSETDPQLGVWKPAVPRCSVSKTMEIYL